SQPGLRKSRGGEKEESIHQYSEWKKAHDRIGGNSRGTHLQALEPTEEVEAWSLDRAFGPLSAQRIKRGVRSLLARVLSLLVLGKFAEMTSFAGMLQWVR